MFGSTGLHLSSSAHIFPTRNPNGEKRERIQSAFYFRYLQVQEWMPLFQENFGRLTYIFISFIKSSSSTTLERERELENDQNFEWKSLFWASKKRKCRLFCELTAPSMLLFFGPSPPYASCLNLNDLLPLSLSCRKSFTTQERYVEINTLSCCAPSGWPFLQLALFWWSKRMQLTLKWEFLCVWILMPSSQ